LFCTDICSTTTSSAPTYSSITTTFHLTTFNETDLKTDSTHKSTILDTTTVVNSDLTTSSNEMLDDNSVTYNNSLSITVWIAIIISVAAVLAMLVIMAMFCYFKRKYEFKASFIDKSSVSDELNSNRSRSIKLQDDSKAKNNSAFEPENTLKRKQNTYEQVRFSKLNEITDRTNNYEEVKFTRNRSSSSAKSSTKITYKPASELVHEATMDRAKKETSDSTSSEMAVAASGSDNLSVDIQQSSVITYGEVGNPENVSAKPENVTESEYNVLHESHNSEQKMDPEITMYRAKKETSNSVTPEMAVAAGGCCGTYSNLSLHIQQSSGTTYEEVGNPENVSAKPENVTESEYNVLHERHNSEQKMDPEITMDRAKKETSNSVTPEMAVAAGGYCGTYSNLSLHIQQSSGTTYEEMGNPENVSAKPKNVTESEYKVLHESYNSEQNVDPETTIDRAKKETSDSITPEMAVAASGCCGTYKLSNLSVDIQQSSGTIYEEVGNPENVSAKPEKLEEQNVTESEYNFLHESYISEQKVDPETTMDRAKKETSDSITPEMAVAAGRYCGTNRPSNPEIVSAIPENFTESKCNVLYESYHLEQKVDPSNSTLISVIDEVSAKDSEINDIQQSSGTTNEEVGNPENVFAKPENVTESEYNVLHESYHSEQKVVDPSNSTLNLIIDDVSENDSAINIDIYTDSHDKDSAFENIKKFSSSEKEYENSKEVFLTSKNS